MRLDLFSLAVLIHQMLAGRLPYGLPVTHVKSAADLPRLRHMPLWPGLTERLDAVLQETLHWHWRLLGCTGTDDRDDAYRWWASPE